MFVTDYTKHLLDHVKKIHFIGCGGSGMYPLIQILNAKGYVISGSDVLDGSIIQYEREMGVKVSLCLLYTSPSPRDGLLSRMPSSA